MDSPGWFQRRKISKWSAKFCELINQGDYASAVLIYEKYLIPFEKHFSASLQTTYYFQRWQLYNEDRDYMAVEVRAADASDESIVKKCLSAMQVMKWQKILATDLSQLNAKHYERIAYELSGQNKPLITLGLSILKAFRVFKTKMSDGNSWQILKQIVHEMPASEQLEGVPAEIRNRIYLWACWKLQDYHLIHKNRDAISSMLGESGSFFLRKVYDEWGKEELFAGKIKSAVSVLEKMFEKNLTEEKAEVIVSWGINALQNEYSESAVEWLTSHLNQAKEKQNLEWENTMLFGLGLSCLKAGKLIQGIEFLEKLKGRLGKNAAEESLLLCVNNLTADDIIRQILHVQCLAKLKETLDWPMPDEVDPEGGRQVFIQNRALWKKIRQEIDSIIEKTGDCTFLKTWQGQLLTGFLAYVESNVTIDMSLVNDFSVAIEYVDGESTKQKLKAMEGVLTTRARVTDEAKDLLAKNRNEELAVLYSKVLEPMEGAIPPLLRAAVLLALWEKDSTRNIISDLRAISSIGENADILNKCISRLHAIQILSHLIAECSLKKASEKTLPTLSPLEFDKDLLEQATLAFIVIHIRNKDWRIAIEVINSFPDTTNQEIINKLSYLKFYAAWNLNNVGVCLEIIAESIENNSYFTSRKIISHAIKSRQIVNAILSRDTRLIQSIVSEYYKEVEWTLFNNAIVSLTLWLMKKEKLAETVLFLKTLQDEVLPDIDLPKKKSAQIQRLCVFLNGFCKAKLGQYNACIEDFETIISIDIQTEPIGEDPTFNMMAREWSILFKIEASLALTCSITDDVGMTWPSLRRSLEEQSDALRGTSSLQAYADLIMGLVTYLSADILVDDEIVERLAHAQSDLSLHRKTDFIEQIIGQLNWRKHILSEFWIYLSKGRFGDSRAIYQKELEPAFGRRMPNSIKLGMVMADWDHGEDSTADLLKRLAILEHEAPELNKELIQKVKDYILDGDKLRNLTTLLKERKFEEVVEFVQQTEWAGFEKGAMPVAVAVVLVYAFFKLRKTEEAQTLGNQIGQSPRLSDWVKDYGLLLVGYIDFEKENYKDAAEVFGKISKSEVLGHNLDKYWSASHFSNGLQLLKVDQEEEAFDALTKSLTVRGGARENTNLAPLFIHFGLKNIELKNGTKALHAFELLSNSLQDDSDSPESYWYQVLANLGQLLCKALLEDEIIEADTCLEFLEKINKTDVEIPEQNRDAIERVLRIMAICQKFRRERRCDPDKRQRFKKLAEFIKDQILGLELLEEKREQKDPIVLVTKGLVELRTRNPSESTEPLEWLTSAIRLGIQSPRLVHFLEAHRQLQKEMLTTRDGILDLFDIYLASGDIPAKIKGELVRSDNVGELYRLNRAYSPDELPRPEMKNSFAVTTERLEHLVGQVDEGGFANDKELTKLCGTIQSQIKILKNVEKKLLTTEKKIMEIVAQKLRNQSIELSGEF